MSESAFAAVSSYGAGSYSTETRGIRPHASVRASSKIKTGHYSQAGNLYRMYRISQVVD